MADLLKGAEALDEMSARLTPERWTELERRAGISNERDGYASSSRLQERVAGGDISDRPSEAAAARIGGHRDKDPQLAAWREIVRLSEEITAAGERVEVEATRWGPKLESARFDSEEAAAFRQRNPMLRAMEEAGWPLPQGDQRDVFLKALTDMGYMKPHGGLRPLVDGIKDMETSAIEVMTQLNRIEKATGKAKVAAPSDAGDSSPRVTRAAKADRPKATRVPVDESVLCVHELDPVTCSICRP
ncbi:MAG: hypothetical protein ACLQPH_20265 [Acidimicrobiales bacterium]